MSAKGKVHYSGKNRHFRLAKGKVLSLFHGILDISDHNTTEDSYDNELRKTSRTELTFQRISVKMCKGYFVREARFHHKMEVD